MKPQRTVTRWWTLLGICLIVTGCGQSTSPCPVSGKVTVNGKPAAGLYLVFQQDGTSQGKPSSARTAKDGSYSLRVPKPGEYSVTAFWPKQVIEQGDPVEGEDLFRGNFRDPRKPASKAVITPGENALAPIALQFSFAGR